MTKWEKQEPLKTKFEESTPVEQSQSLANQFQTSSKESVPTKPESNTTESTSLADPMNQQLNHMRRRRRKRNQKKKM